MLAFCKQNPASCKKNERTNVFHFRYIVYVIFVNTRIKRDLILTKMLVEDYVSSALRWTEACFCTVGLKGSGMPRLDYTMQKPLFFFIVGAFELLTVSFPPVSLYFPHLPSFDIFMLILQKSQNAGTEMKTRQSHNKWITNEASRRTDRWLNRQRHMQLKAGLQKNVVKIVM